MTTPVTSIPQGQFYLYAARALDPDGDPITYSFISGPNGMSMDPVTGEVSWDTTYFGQGNSYAVSLQADDGRGGRALQNFTVTVTAAAPALKTEDAGLGQDVAQSTVAALPYFNRSAGALLALAPTVRYAGEDVISYGASRYNIGGMTNVNVYVDGGSVNGDREDVAQMVLNPSVEALQQVKITENMYSSQFGRDVGPMVQMETKSGSNALHGGVYYYNRNEAFDTYQAYTDTKPVDRQDMFGGTLGGALKKDKLFFFESFEGQKNITPFAFLGTVPTPQMTTPNLRFTVPNPAVTVPNPAVTATNPAVTTVTNAVAVPTPGVVAPTSLPSASPAVVPVAPVQSTRTTMTTRGLPAWKELYVSLV